MIHVKVSEGLLNVTTSHHVLHLQAGHDELS